MKQWLQLQRNSLFDHIWVLLHTAQETEKIYASNTLFQQFSSPAIFTTSNYFSRNFQSSNFRGKEFSWQGTIFSAIIFWKFSVWELFYANFHAIELNTHTHTWKKGQPDTFIPLLSHEPMLMYDCRAKSGANLPIALPPVFAGFDTRCHQMFGPYKLQCSVVKSGSLSLTWDTYISKLWSYSRLIFFCRPAFLCQLQNERKKSTLRHHN